MTTNTNSLTHDLKSGHELQQSLDIRTDRVMGRVQSKLDLD